MITNEDIKQIRQLIRDELSVIIKIDRQVFNKNIQILDNRNIQFGNNNGTKIGTGINEKLAFHNSTPVIQRAGAVQDAVVTTGSTQTTPYGYTTAAQANAIVTLLNEIRAALVEKGLIKGSS